MKTGFEPVEISRDIFIPANRILNVQKTNSDSIMVYYLSIDDKPINTVH